MFRDGLIYKRKIIAGEAFHLAVMPEDSENSGTTYEQPIKHQTIGRDGLCHGGSMRNSRLHKPVDLSAGL